MAEAAADTAPARRRPAFVATTATSSDVVSARLQQVLALLFPSSVAAKAALFALVVALLPLLPSGQAAAPRIWELPYLLLLGIIISYGVFGQKNADDADVVVAAAADADAATKPVVPVDAAAASVEAYVSQMMHGSLPLVFEDDDGRDGSGGKDGGGIQAWSSQYLPDDPLVVVADTTTGTKSNAGEKPLLLPLPVRKLKPAAEESAALTTGDGDMMMHTRGDDAEVEEESFLGPSKAGYVAVREHAIPSPSSVLDADLTLSPSSPPLLPPPPPPPPPPFLGRGRSFQKAKARSFNEFGVLGINRSIRSGSLGLHGAGTSRQFRSKSAFQATRRAFAGYEPVVPVDDDEADDEELGLDDMAGAAAPDSSFSSEVATDVDDDTIKEEEENSCEEDERGVDDGNSCDEELFELAARPGPEVEAETEEEVDRKADEFIAKFREQIRMQRVEPGRR